MSRRQQARVQAIERYVPRGFYRFLWHLADYANDEGRNAFPRTRTLLQASGLSEGYFHEVRRQCAMLGWTKEWVVGAGVRRRTRYELHVPPPSWFAGVSVPQRFTGKGQLQLPLEAVENPAENLTEPVDGSELQPDPGHSFSIDHSFLTPSIDWGLAPRSVSDPKNLDPKNVQKKERPPLARRHSPPRHAADLDRLQFASRNLKARLERDRQRAAAARKGRR